MCLRIGAQYSCGTGRYGRYSAPFLAKLRDYVDFRVCLVTFAFFFVYSFLFLLRYRR